MRWNADAQSERRPIVDNRNRVKIKGIGEAEGLYGIMAFVFVVVIVAAFLILH